MLCCYNVLCIESFQVIVMLKFCFHKKAWKTNKCGRANCCVPRKQVLVIEELSGPEVNDVITE